jgi:hypothetical protein
MIVVVFFRFFLLSSSSSSAAAAAGPRHHGTRKGWVHAIAHAYCSNSLEQNGYTYFGWLTD